MPSELVPLFTPMFDSRNADASPSDERPLLFIDNADLPTAAQKLAVRLGDCGDMFCVDGHLVRVVVTPDGVAIEPQNIHSIVNAAHEVCRPAVVREINGAPVVELKTLPARVATLLLHMRAKWGAPPLKGICAGVLLSADGEIRCAAGYDPGTRYWCVGVESPAVPEFPTYDQAAAALLTLRDTFRTFSFADRPFVGAGQADVIDTSRPPGRDESSYLAAVLTTVARPSLPLAPGALIRAPKFSGAGVGKGRLVRAPAAIAFGGVPQPFTAGADQAELDKRLASALFTPKPMVWLDNANSETLNSHLLAQVLSEEACGGRPLGTSKLTTLTDNAMIVVTGNRVYLSEDLTRRFLVVELDPRCENPENRRFSGDFVAMIMQRRGGLLAAALTIWRWGRQQKIDQGVPIGSFEQWASWVRDPLLALGCQDPIARHAEMKSDDPQRLNLVEFFSQWRRRYGDQAVTANAIDAELAKIAGLAACRT